MPIGNLKKDPAPGTTTDGTIIRTDQHNELVDIISGDAAAKIPNLSLVDIAQSKVTGLVAALAGKQPLDSDLTDIAALSPPNDDVIQRKSGVWTNRTPAQLKTDLSLTKSDISDTGTWEVSEIPTLTSAKISDFDTQVRTSRLDQMAAPNTNLSINSNKLINVTDPTAAQDAATKSYVDNIAVNGVVWKDSVRVATTANITLSGTQTIDGVSVIAGDRVLVKDQSTASQNGVYVCASGAWTRATDCDSSAEILNMATFVEEGTVSADQGFVLTTNAPIVIDVTSLNYTQFTGLGQITAGLALSKTGNTLDVNVDNTGIEVNSDALRLKDLGVTFAKIQNITTARILGRNTAGSGSIEELTAATTKTLLAIVKADISDFAHQATHNSGGTDALKLDDLATPDDNTDLNASTSRHGLLPKLPGGTANFLREDGTFTAPTASAISTWKNSVRAATTTNGALATAYENGDTIDGVVLATGNRILIKNQSTATENGIYTVNSSGAPTRATDFDAGADLIANSVVMVQEGTVNADTAWQCTTNETITIGSTSLTFAQFGAGGSSPLTTKGDLFGYDTVNARIPIGANGTKLVADSAQGLGLKWSRESVVTKTTTATLTTIEEGVILAQPGTTAFTITLPAAAGNTGLHYKIKHTSVEGAVVTIDGNSSETINGNLTVQLEYFGTEWELYCDGNNWYGSYNPNIFRNEVMNIQFDDFISGTEIGEVGELGWIFVGVGTETSAQIDGTSTHCGIMRQGTSAASGDDCDTYLGGSATSGALNPYLPDTEIDVTFMIRITTVTSVIVRVGLAQVALSNSAETNHNALWLFDPAVSANWRTRTRAAADTTNTTGTAVAAATWYKLRIVKSGSNIRFYLNDVFQFNHTTNLPTNALSPYIGIDTTEVVAKTIDIDYFHMRYKANR